MAVLGLRAFLPVGWCQGGYYLFLFSQFFKAALYGLKFRTQAAGSSAVAGTLVEDRSLFDAHLLHQQSSRAVWFE